VARILALSRRLELLWLLGAAGIAALVWLAGLTAISLAQ